MRALYVSTHACATPNESDIIVARENWPLMMRALAFCVIDGLTDVPDVKGLVALEALAGAATDSRSPTLHSVSRRFASARTYVLHAPFS